MRPNTPPRDGERAARRTLSSGAARYITACQQLLALGAVLAVLTPAASVVSLDVVRQQPHRPATATPTLPAHDRSDLTAYGREAARESEVPTEVVDAKVREYPLTAPDERTGTPDLAARRTKDTGRGTTEVVSEPEPVSGYGAVGVTWTGAEQVADDEIEVAARTRTGSGWSEWTELAYDADHGPDPASPEGRRARPGTDVLLVGEVDEVQVRSVSRAGRPPSDMRLAVVEPGEATETTTESAAIDAAALDGTTGATSAAGDEPPAETGEEGLDLQAAMFTPKPVIYSRAQWGANESLRDRGSLRYFEVHAGFVHHTVNANDYSRTEVPGILRGIYAYHTQSRGWSDVGYNFLVDRFGRIWEGRAGGVDRPVVGAHTLGYNDYAFAMSAIGNFETAQPSAAMLEAYGSLMAWKLSLHGIDASSDRQRVGTRDFRAINGHRDAGQTACPGRYLYARLPVIREKAAAAQRGWTGRELESDLASTKHPDLVVRRASDGKGFVIPTGGGTRFQKPERVVDAWRGVDSLVSSPDLTGDGVSDLVVRADEGTTRIRPGTGEGGFGEPTRPYDGLAGRDLITPVGDLDGDGRNDLVARNLANGRLHAFLGAGGGAGAAGFEMRALPGDWTAYDRLAATGDVTRDGHVDLLARADGGNLWLYPGTGGLRFGDPVELTGRWGRYDTITGFGDYTRDGRPDLLVREKDGSGQVLPLLADGTFGHPLGPVERLRRPAALSGGGQLAGDQAPDLVGRRGDDLLVYPNAGSFDLGGRIPIGANLSGVDRLLNAGDWDRDGDGDVITRLADDGVLQLRRGDGTGTLAAPTRLSRGFGNVDLLAAVGDMTGDGWPDLMGQPAGGGMRIYPGNGHDGLGASYVAHGRIDAARQVPIGRWNADGAPDSLFRRGDRFHLYPGNGPGGLTSPRQLALDLRPYDWVLGVSDLRLGGHADVVVRERSTGHLWSIPGTKNGFKGRWFLGAGMKEYDLVG